MSLSPSGLDVDLAAAVHAYAGWASAVGVELQTTTASSTPYCAITEIERRAAVHDLRNILQVISSGVRLTQIRMAKGQTNEAHQMCARLASCVENANVLAASIFMDRQQEPLSAPDVELAELLHDAAFCFSWILGPTIKLSLHVADNLAPIRCVEAELQHALLNLVINARDAMPDGGAIALTAARAIAHDDEGVVLHIRDSGHGMSPEIAARAFEPYFTAKADGTGLGLGLGLGLASVASFVKKVGGEIEIERSAPTGTSMMIFLPAAT